MRSRLGTQVVHWLRGFSVRKSRRRDECHHATASTTPASLTRTFSIQKQKDRESITCLKAVPNAPANQGRRQLATELKRQTQRQQSKAATTLENKVWAVFLSLLPSQCRLRHAGRISRARLVHAVYDSSAAVLCGPNPAQLVIHVTLKTCSTSSCRTCQLITVRE